MKIQDLGELTGPVLLFGGVYSNLQALDAFIAQAHALGIPAQNCICTGDTVAYCANPYEVVESIRTFGCRVLAGNCEQQLGASLDDCGCGFEDGSTCSLLSMSWYRHASQSMTEAQRAWMRGLPDRIVFALNGTRYGVVHGGASHVSKFIWPNVSDEDLRFEIELLFQQVGPLDCVIAGHTGLAMDRKLDVVRWLNPGAIGMPANDGVAATSYGILNDDKFEIQNLKYNAHDARDAMEKVGLIQGYNTCLTSGYWPSEETLPPELRRYANG